MEADEMTPGPENNVKWAIIPKGAEYCLGEYCEVVVSNRIIVFSSKEKMEKYVSTR